MNIEGPFIYLIILINVLSSITMLLIQFDLKTVHDKHNKKQQQNNVKCLHLNDRKGKTK